MAIADAILNQIQQAGQPRTVKSTETVTGKEPIDLGGLGLLLYMLMQGMGKGAGPGEPPLGGDLSAGFMGPGLQQPAIPNFGAPAVSAGQNFGGMDPMQLIMSLINLPRSPGIGGF